MENKQKQYVIFLIKYFSVILLFYILLLIFEDNLLEQYLESTALFASALLNLFYNNIAVVGSKISNSYFSVQVSYGCDGTEAIILFLAGIIAFKTNIKKKIIGISIGIILIYLLNIFRIVILFYVGNINTGFFNSLHTIYFPILFIMIPILLLLVWIDYVKK